jgi:ribosomal protein L21E
MKEDPTVTQLKRALSERLEIDFNAFGTAHRMKPHILYVDSSGVLKIAGVMGDLGIVKIPVGQIKDLIVSPRHFQPDPTFNRSDADYDNPITTVAS